MMAGLATPELSDPDGVNCVARDNLLIRNSHHQFGLLIITRIHLSYS